MLNSVEEEFDLKCLGRERPLTFKVEQFIKLTMIESSDWFAIVSDESRDDGVDLKNADYVRCAYDTCSCSDFAIIADKALTS